MLKISWASLRATEAKIVLVLLACFAVADCGLRMVDQRLSGNIAHIESIPSLVASAGSNAERSMLIVGNSLTNNGVDEKIVAARLSDVGIAKITPDGTSLWEWKCLLEREVLRRQDVQIDVVVIGFAWHLLSDQARADASKLGALYCELGDIRRPTAIGLASFGDRAEFLLARISRIYAMRDVLRNRVLPLVIPHYKTYTQQANAAGFGQEQKTPTYTYEHFGRLVATLEQKGTQIIVVAMPVQTDYEVDPELRELAARGKIGLIDLRDTEGLDASTYLDAMHLNARGQQLLSEQLAVQLARAIEKNPS